MHRVLCFLLLALLSNPATAQDRVTIGIGGLLNNDVFTATPNNDRWRTGSGVVSIARAPGWDGALPERMGEILEFRLRGGLISPERINGRALDDRPYAETLSLGMHTHFQRQSFEYSLGLDLVATGPQTGMESLQSAIHDLLGIPSATAGALRGRVDDGLYPTLGFEMGRSLDLSPRVSFRPFIEVQGGIETYARIGGDWHFGRIGHDALMVRDVTTGQRYALNRGEEKGWGATLGADIAYVADSALLPETRRLQLSDSRTRVRGGVRYFGENYDFFYGLTWLGKEFESQSEGQTVGSLRLNLKF